MKRIIRLLVILLVIISLTGITSSCGKFIGTTVAQKPEPFKHKKPLPKKYIVNYGNNPIAK